MRTIPEPNDHWLHFYDRLVRDRDDRSAVDSDVSYRIELGLGVHDTASTNHQIVALARLSASDLRCGERDAGDNDDEGEGGVTR